MSRGAGQSWEQLVSDLDHDLRAPLAIIRGEVELVLSQPDASPEERKRSTTSVLHQIEHMEQVLVRRMGDESTS